MGADAFATLAPGMKSGPIEPTRGAVWRPARPGRYRVVGTYTFTPREAEWTLLPFFRKRLYDDEDVLAFRRTRAFTRSARFDLDVP